MQCSCEAQPSVLLGDDENLPGKTLKKEAWIPNQWNTLFKCSVCGQHWQVDIWDKYQTGLAIKISSREEWGNFDDEPIRFQFMIDSRGGVSEKVCQWKGCNEFALKNLAFCPWHAYYECGIRS